MEDVTSPGIVVKLLHIAPLGCAPDAAWDGHCLSVDLPPAFCSLHLCCSDQPSSLLERPEALRVDALQQQLCSPTTQQAIRTAMAAYHAAAANWQPLADLPADPLRLADSMALVDFGGCAALLLMADRDAPKLILPPEGFTGLPDDEDEDSLTVLEGSSETRHDKSMAELAARLLLTQILSCDGTLCAPAAAARKDRQIYFVWAESAEGLKVSPSLLLAHTLLTSRREAAMFLRMASGFGFGQVGDYTASLFYLFRRRGHRLKCWECGVKKKAPCGKIARDDLPWCCHRRLGEWVPLLRAQAPAPGGPITFAAGAACFLTLLPPREAIESEDPLAMQLGYAPRAADVVCLSDVLVDNATHPRQPLRKALHRLAPTCRLLWANTPWIVKTMHQMAAGKDGAAAAAHFWLEKTAFFKVPRNLQDESMEQHRRPFEDLVEELLPDVKEAPVLGGHNRVPHAAAPPPPPARQPKPIARALSRAASFSGGGLPPHPGLGHFQPEGAPAPVLAYALGHSSGSEAASLACFGADRLEPGVAGPDGHGWPNTGQGRRRLNARAALRAATRRDAFGQPLAPALALDLQQQPPATPLPAAELPAPSRGGKQAQAQGEGGGAAGSKLAQLHILVNAGAEDHPSSGLSEGSPLPHRPASGQACDFPPKQLTRFASAGPWPQREASDQGDDEEWRPPAKQRRLDPPVAHSGSSRLCVQASGGARAAWRKPRTARLQFWNVQRKGGNRSQLGLPRQDSGLVEAWSGGCSRDASPPQAAELPADDNSPSREDSGGCRGFAAMEQLLHAVELAGMSE